VYRESESVWWRRSWLRLTVTFNSALTLSIATFDLCSHVTVSLSTVVVVVVVGIVIIVIISVGVVVADAVAMVTR